MSYCGTSWVKTGEDWVPLPARENAYYDHEMDNLFFEISRIRHFQDERVNIHKRTFTRWCNFFLDKARMEIGDLFVDVGDGILLMKLLEIISGEKLGKPNCGRLRIQKIENLNIVFDFLKKKHIELENIGSEDILDRNERLILGLIWTIILRFQIDTIVIENEEEDGEPKNARDALLLWCQQKTAGYPNVRIENFTTSWRSGLAFNALIHAHRPDSVDFDQLSPTDHVANLNNAFDVAERELEIARLLDAEDVDAARPDEKSIITYLSLCYHNFAEQKAEIDSAKEIANIVGKLLDSEIVEDDYEYILSELINWIQVTIQNLESRREKRQELAQLVDSRRNDLQEQKKRHTNELHQRRKDLKKKRNNERTNVELEEENIRKVHEIDMKTIDYEMKMEKENYQKLLDEENEKMEDIENARRQAEILFKENFAKNQEQFESDRYEMIQKLYAARIKQLENDKKKTEIECRKALAGIREANDLTSKIELSAMYQKLLNEFLNVREIALGVIEANNRLCVFIDQIDEGDMKALSYYNNEFNRSNTSMFYAADLLINTLSNNPIILDSSILLRPLRNLCSIYNICSRVPTEIDMAIKKVNLEELRNKRNTLDTYSIGIGSVTEEIREIDWDRYIREEMSSRRNSTTETFEDF